MDFVKLLAALASAAGIVTAAAKLFLWLRTPAHKLEVKVGWNSFRLPPHVQIEMAEQWTKVEKIFDSERQEAADDERAKEVARHVRDIFWEVKNVVDTQPSFELRTMQGFWSATVINSGKKKCTDVNLRLPHATHVLIKHDREASGVPAIVNEVVHLGELRPGGECEVLAWTGWLLSNSAYSGIGVSHDSGVGRVRGEWRTDGFSHALSSFIKASMPAVIGMALTFTGVVTIPWIIKESPIVSSRASSPPNGDYEDFIRRYSQLEGRDREQEDYVDSAVGEQIEWDVTFDHASTMDHDVFVTFRYDPRSPANSGSIALNQRDRVFALHSGDRIHITGRLKKLSSRSLHVEIAGFQLLSQAPPHAATPKPTSGSASPAPR